MLARALIVLLVVLNLGVAVWWAARGAPSPTPASAFAPDVPKLRLLREMPGGVAPAPPASAQPGPAQPGPAQTTSATAGTATAPGDAAATPPPAAAVEHCYAFGPFAADAVEPARKRLQAFATRVRERNVAAAASGSWRVMLPVAGDRAAAQAVATRIAAAGFSDYYIVAGGDGANTIALGLYGSEAAARQRTSALQAAGFADVRAEAIGSAAPQVWFDAAVVDAASPKALGGRVGASRVQPLDCATVR